MNDRKGGNSSVFASWVMVLVIVPSTGIARGQDVVQPSAGDPICIHPENPKYFLFRGQPLVLIAAPGKLASQPQFAMS